MLNINRITYITGCRIIWSKIFVSYFTADPIAVIATLLFEPSKVISHAVVAIWLRLHREFQVIATQAIVRWDIARRQCDKGPQRRKGSWSEKV